MEITRDEIEKIELRTNEVQEILNRPPKWIVRWGITIVFVVVAIIIISSWFFKYPDIISARVILTTENPPAPVIAKVSGRIQSLLVVDNEMVIQGQVVGIMENPGAYESVNSLSDQIEKFELNFAEGKTYTLGKTILNLGEIQSYYASFFKYIDEYNNFIQLDYHNRKISQYKNELVKYDLYLTNLKSQSNILKQEYLLTKKQFLRDSTLYLQELMSEADFDISESNLLTKSYNYEQNNISITNVEIQVESLKQSILELELQRKSQANTLVNQIRESYKNLDLAIQNWNYKYVLKTSTNGIVTFNKFWNENQNVKVNETVLTIIPQDEGDIIGKVQLNFQGAGKVKVGQKVNIQFANYPYMEFGMVKGIVNSISLAPNDEFYTAEIGLPDGLITFYGETLEFKQEMQGSAEIITEDKRLLERIIRPLRYVLNRNTNIERIKN